MKKIIMTAAMLALSSGFAQADSDANVNSEISMQQSRMLAEAARQVPLPSIVNFQERRMLKTIYELRDSAIATHTYIVNQMTGCLVYLGPSVGYGMPYATQYTSPTTYGRLDNPRDDFPRSYGQKPQAEPNGLFMPSEAHGTWVLMKDPEGTEVKPVYIEPDVMVVPFRLKNKECK